MKEMKIEELEFTRAYRIKLIGNLDTILERIKKVYESIKTGENNFIEFE